MRDEQNWAALDRNENLQSVVRDAVKIEDHGEWTNVRVKNPDFRWQHQQRRQNQECIVSTKNKFEVLSKLEYAPDDNDETEAPIHVVDHTNHGKWIKEEAVVDSGAVECVTTRKRVPHLKVEETPDSRRGENVDVRWRKRDQERRQSHDQLDGVRCFEKRSVQNKVGVSHADEC